jgi:hypothetical protein
MFHSEGLRAWITAIVANSLLATQLTMATPPGEWGSATVGVDLNRPLLTVDPETSIGTTAVLLKSSAVLVSNIGESVVLWNNGITGHWGLEEATMTASESDGNASVYIALSRSTVAVQFTRVNGSSGYAWGIRANALVKVKGPHGMSIHEQSQIALMGTTQTLAEAVAASQAAAAFFSALPEPGQSPSMQVALPTSGSWNAYWDCFTTCFASMHPGAFQNFQGCLAILGIYSGTVLGGCFLGCLGAPPCVAGCVAGMAGLGGAIAGACLAQYLTSCGVITAACAWECW